MKIVFVTRPKMDDPARGIQAMLFHTAKNGKAVRVPRLLGGQYSRVARSRGLVFHQTRRGKFVYAWCENGTRATKKGAR